MNQYLIQKNDVANLRFWIFFPPWIRIITFSIFHDFVSFPSGFRYKADGVVKSNNLLHLLSDGNIASHCWFQISFVSALFSNINNDFYAILKNWRSAHRDTHINMYIYWLVSWFLFSFFLDVRWISSLCETAGFPKVKISYIIFRFRIVVFFFHRARSHGICTRHARNHSLIIWKPWKIPSFMILFTFTLLVR